MTDQLLFTVPEVAKLTKLGLKTVQAAIQRGDLKALLKPPANRTKVVRREDIDKWLDSFTVA
jgi:excisionase family DNA binding protein